MPRNNETPHMTSKPSVSPDAPTTGERPRLTVEQANRMLPLVAHIVADIVTDHHARREARDARTRRRLATDIRRYVDELTALGVECKSLDEGLVDFPGLVDGTPVLLCWKLGEPAIAWWHPVDSGFAGRRPLPVVEAAR